MSQDKEYIKKSKGIEAWSPERESAEGAIASFSLLLRHSPQTPCVQEKRRTPIKESLALRRPMGGEKDAPTRRGESRVTHPGKPRKLNELIQHCKRKLTSPLKRGDCEIKSEL